MIELRPGVAAEEPAKAPPFVALEQRWLEAVIRQPLPASQLRVLLAIAVKINRFWADGGAPQKMTYSELAATTGMFRTTCIAAVSELEAAGIISVARRGLRPRGGGGRYPNILGLEAPENWARALGLPPVETSARIPAGSRNGRPQRTVDGRPQRTVEQSPPADRHRGTTTPGNQTATRPGNPGLIRCSQTLPDQVPQHQLEDDPAPFDPAESRWLSEAEVDAMFCPPPCPVHADSPREERP